MSIFEWVGILLVPLFIALVFYTIYGKLKIERVSKGHPIDREGRPNTALLVIDVQEDFTQGLWDEELLNEQLQGINHLVKQADTNEIPVLTIRQTYQGWYTNFIVGLLGKGKGARNSKGLQLDPRLKISTATDMIKPYADAFSALQLDRVLAKQRVGRLILAGLDGNFCIKITALAALNRGFEVHIAEGALLFMDHGKWVETKNELIAMGVKVSPVHMDDLRVEAA
ncbi:cysteine hydrolase family protein [Flexibacterium corallicola]|uniref:cysteine hydrolase family protein n=1 Tax=Flexibacterium corallicola TaxID=3037259 RepID=UPI00286F10E4|nr:isochorismatase family cysteine hydrolase [Pseudovibrio sp. M1P-2-3]